MSAHSLAPSMGDLRRIAWSALAGGLAAGLVLFALQWVWLEPLIQEAERYERGAAASMEAAPGSAPREGEPAEDSLWRRRGGTLLGILASSVGFGLLLGAGFLLSGRPVNAGRGAVWGLAGFAAFVLAPALGLPPEPPGVEGAPLPDRQLWWAGTVLCTAGGLWALAFARWQVKVAGLVLLALPHLLGAPETPPEAVSPIPEDLTFRYQAAVIALNGVFWIALGAVSGWLWRRSS